MNLEILYGAPKKAKNKHMYIKSGTFSPPYKCRAGESSLSILKEKTLRQQLLTESFAIVLFCFLYKRIRINFLSRKDKRRWYNTATNTRWYINS